LYCFNFYYLCTRKNDTKVNLIVEQGNTMLKVAVFDGNERVMFFQKESNELSWIQDVFGQYRLEKGIMSSVKGQNKKLTQVLKSELSFFLWLDETIPVPLRIEYETIKTLGKDRIAAVVGANFLRPGQHLLVIDAGTAITYELVEAAGIYKGGNISPGLTGIYKGGNISPGLTTRFRSLNRFTKQLPLVQEQADVPLIGTNTESAILAGVVNGIVFEMDGYMDALKVKYNDIYVYLTGGHAFYFENRLKNRIFVAPNLVLLGLNRILEYNAAKN